MRTLGVSAIVLAAGLATLSIIFIELAYSNGWSDGSALLGGFEPLPSPSLLAIPVLMTMAWGFMLSGLMLVIDKVP